MAKKRKALPAEPVEAEIESLTRDGCGLARIGDKRVQVYGGLPGERVLFRYTKIRPQYDDGVVAEVLRAAADRVEPRCPHFGICGGCSFQHLVPSAQMQLKQGYLADAFSRTGEVQPREWLPALVAGHWGYRRKARLGVRYVAKKGRVLVGFRERGNSFVADLNRCEILHPSVGEKIDAIAALLQGLSIRERVPQVEVAAGEGLGILVFRVLDRPSGSDLEQLGAFGAEHGLRIFLQDGGRQTIRPLPGQETELHYDLPGHAVRIYFGPTDFTQVNLELNRLMVDRAIDLLEPQPSERVLDLFCGLGNFSLPLARRALEVVGVEGDPALVERACANARCNGLANVRFHTADLYGELESAPWSGQGFAKALLDPPRSGAREVLELLPRLGVRRLVYVSCNPETLALDADRLVNGLDYRLLAAGVMDMFPHTAHVESIAVFERSESGLS